MSVINVKSNWKQFKLKMKTRWGRHTGSHIVPHGIDEKISPEEKCTGHEQNPSRRAALRGMLAVTCGLLLPITLFSSPANAADTAEKKPKSAKKVPKASVKYQYKPNGNERCGTCVNFIAASKTCKRVAGPIDPNGWCILWGKAA